jgi:hypothetical protein
MAKEHSVNLQTKISEFCTFDLMDNKDLNKDQLIQYWIEGSEDDFETMAAMFNSKKYSWSLFIGHLMIENC